MICLAGLGACDDASKTDPKAKTEVKKADEKKAEEKKAEAKVEEKAEAKVEEKAEAKVEEKAEAKVEEKAEAKVEEKAEAKVEEKKTEDKKATDKPTPTTDKPDPGPSADGKGLFEKKCKNCHNSNGDGKTKIGEENEIEDWTVAGWKGKWSQDKIEGIVTDGKSGTKMKPFKDKMTADEIVAVSKFARSLGK